MLVRMWRKGNPRALLVRMQLWKTIWRFLKMLNTE